MKIYKNYIAIIDYYIIVKIYKYEVNNISLISLIYDYECIEHAAEIQISITRYKNRTPSDLLQPIIRQPIEK